MPDDVARTLACSIIAKREFYVASEKKNDFMFLTDTNALYTIDEVHSEIRTRNIPISCM
jgi:hypothetical protein